MNPDSKTFVVDTNWRGRTIDSRGQQNFRSGQAIDTGILSAIPSAYSLLVYHPFASAMLFLGCTILIAEYYDSPGPLEFAFNALVTVVKNPNTTDATKNVAVGAATVVEVAIDWKTLLAKFCLVFFTYAVKPSTRNLIFSGMLFVIYYFKTMSFLALAVTSQCFYLFVTVRNPIWKFVFLAVLVISLFTDLFSIIKISGTLVNHQSAFEKQI